MGRESTHSKDHSLVTRSKPSEELPFEIIFNHEYPRYPVTLSRFSDGSQIVFESVRDAQRWLDHNGYGQDDLNYLDIGVV